MNINSSMQSLHLQQLQLNTTASNISQVSNVVADPKLSQASEDIITSLTQLIPTSIAYEATLEGIKVQNAVQDVLLDIKV